MKEWSRLSRSDRRFVVCAALSRLSEPLDGFDADDGGDRGDLEATPGVAEVLLDGVYIEPPADLL